MYRRFQFFNPVAETHIKHRNLPHWEQPDVCYFLTFRTADALLAEALSAWHEERHAWLRAHGIDPVHEKWHSQLEELSDALRAEFHDVFSRKMHVLLDAGHGECLLRRRDLRDMMTKSLHHFDGQRYLLGGYVVMPNHVHALTKCLGETTLKSLCYSWKHYTAHRIHQALGRVGCGPFWQDETFDHIVRSAAQFEKFQRYLAENPVKARLREGEFTLFLPEVET